jgi:hypothetical protein
MEPLLQLLEPYMREGGEVERIMVINALDKGDLIVLSKGKNLDLPTSDFSNLNLPDNFQFKVKDVELGSWHHFLGKRKEDLWRRDVTDHLTVNNQRTYHKKG